MNTRIITDSEIESLKVASLPTRPTAPTAFGGKGYTATEMKEAFDKLPLRILQEFNLLVQEIKNGTVATMMCQLDPLRTLISDVAAIKAHLGLGEETL